jgi:rfaE bifunctional protein nucleotidyltransferase chain/domain
MLNKKLLKNLRDLIVLRKKTKKKIGLCHGVFDILHFGHLKHLEEAKKHVDVLVLSITEDSFVNKGPIQPYNSGLKRAFFLSSINFVDYVFINKDITAVPVIQSLKPNLYFKGQDYLGKDITNNLKKETSQLKKFGGFIKITNTELMSSTKILNNKVYDWENSQKEFLIKLSSKSNFNKIIEYFNKIEDYEINIIGEVILDKYIFTDFVGVTSKDPAMSLLENSHEVIPGGAMAIAKILSQFVKKVNFYTYGNTDLLKSNIQRTSLLSTVLMYSFFS